MDSQPKVIKFLNSLNSSNWSQLEVTQNEEINFVFTSESQFSTSFGPFAYKDKHQKVNLKGKLIYNSEKAHYEMTVETGRIEVSPKSMLGFSAGPSTLWEGDSFKTFLEKFEKVLVWFYNDENSRFAKNPEPTVVLSTSSSPPLFCNFYLDKNYCGDMRLGGHWLPLAKEGYCLIF